MDDNKLLTLANNERIALTPQMRLIFEISHLKYASPATVSRAGVLFFNVQDLGWMPYLTSWVETRLDGLIKQDMGKENVVFVGPDIYAKETEYLKALMNLYVPSCMQVMRRRFRTVVPMPEFCHLQTLSRILDCLLTPEVSVYANGSPNPKQVYELYFCFACVWAFGSALNSEIGSSQRFEFSNWWIGEFKTISFPLSLQFSSIFDFCIDSETHTLVPWTAKQSKWQTDIQTPIYSSLFPTAQVTCLKYFMNLFVTKKQPILLIGSSGSGKTTLVKEVLRNLPEDCYVTQTIPMHHYMTSNSIQTTLEKPLEKKSGMVYGAPGNRNIIFFLDDLNVPFTDKYGTVHVHTVLRQQLCYGYW